MVPVAHPEERPWLTAWRPQLAGVSEVLHARFTDHVYPMHAHASWTLLLVEQGMVRYDLHRHEYGTLDHSVTLLPPQVPHNGRAATEGGFRKRVVYLDATQLDSTLAGRAVDHPVVCDPALRHHVHALHTALTHPGEEPAAEAELVLVTDRLRRHLERETDPEPPRRDPGLAHRLRELLDARLVEGCPLGVAGELLHAHPVHLVRVFRGEFGMAPHEYLTSRRVDLARHLLLEGMPLGDAATASGFYDQPHLTRHFKRLLGTPPGRFARSRAAQSP